MGNSNYTVRLRPIIVGEWFSMVTTSGTVQLQLNLDQLGAFKKMKRVEAWEKAWRNRNSEISSFTTANSIAQ